MGQLPSMTFVEALGLELEERSLSKKDAAIQSEVSPSTVYAWFSRQGSDPSVETARQLCKSLGLTIEGLIAKHTPYSPTDYAAEVVEPVHLYGATANKLLRLAQRLTEEDLQEIVAIAELKISRARAKESQTGSGS